MHSILFGRENDIFKSKFFFQYVVQRYQFLLLNAFRRKEENLGRELHPKKERKKARR